VARKGESQGPIYSLFYPDAGRNENFADAKSVIAQLKGRDTVEQIQAVVVLACEAERLAKSAGARGELPGWCAWGKPSIQSHLRQTFDRFKRADQYASGLAVGLAGDIHAKIAAIDCVDIGMARGAKDNGVARCGAMISVSCRIGRLVVRAQVGFHFDDSACQDARGGSRDQEFAEQARSHALRRLLKKGARKKIPRRQHWRAE